jgi:hypothetical protein
MKRESFKKQKTIDLNVKDCDWLSRPSPDYLGLGKRRSTRSPCRARGYRQLRQVQRRQGRFWR